MGDEPSDEEQLRRFAEWIEAGDATVAVYDTPLGRKVSPKTTADTDEEFTFSGDELESSRAVAEVEDVILALDEGDIDVVNEVDDEVWEEFVTVASEALEDVGEEELRAARDG
ncbi:hypothetical protein ACLI4Z_09060 [Natrialbaceae archaeon A-arb3/5]